MQTHRRNTLSLILGAVPSYSKQTSSDRAYRGAARWRAFLLSIMCYYVTWASCPCSIFVAGQPSCQTNILQKDYKFDCQDCG